jgi:hypothetical protein
MDSPVKKERSRYDFPPGAPKPDFENVLTALRPVTPMHASIELGKREVKAL